MFVVLLVDPHRILDRIYTSFGVFGVCKGGLGSRVIIDFGDEGNANVSLLQLKTPLIFERGGHQLWKLKLLE